jgi:hypothetical protein
MKYIWLIVTAVSVILFSACGGGGENKAFTNPDWQDEVAESVTFPLEEEITIRAVTGKNIDPPDFDSAAFEWVKDKTNINLEFVNVASSPGDVNFGMMIREGNLPELVWEERIPKTQDRNIIVNILDFPGLIPNFTALYRENEYFRRGIDAKITEDGTLYSFGTFDPDYKPMASVLAYRQDLFEKHKLKVKTWEDVYSSLRFLKKEYPKSAPFGGRLNDIIYTGPGWFGSGLTREHVIYWDPGQEDWVFGPAEEGFYDFVEFFSRLNRDGLLSADLLVDSQTPVYQFYTRGTVFMGPLYGFTGPYFPWDKSEYGALTDQGTWNGEKVWISSLPLPVPPSGSSPKASAALSSFVSEGWMVYNQSPYAAEALALLDFFYLPETSAVMSLGPEGTSWKETSDGKIELTGPFGDMYRQNGKGAVAESLSEKDIISKSFPAGYKFPWDDMFGYSDAPYYQYLLKNDFRYNTPGEEIIMQPGIHIPRGEDQFINDRINLVMALESNILQAVSRFITGQKPMEDFPEFLKDIEGLGKDLISLYREQCVFPDPEF